MCQNITPFCENSLSLIVSETKIPLYLSTFDSIEKKANTLRGIWKSIGGCNP